MYTWNSAGGHKTLTKNVRMVENNTGEKSDWKTTSVDLAVSCESFDQEKTDIIF